MKKYSTYLKIIIIPQRQVTLPKYPLEANKKNCSITTKRHMTLLSVSLPPFSELYKLRGHTLFFSTKLWLVGSSFYLLQKQMGLNSKRVEDLTCHETILRIPTEAIMQTIQIHNVCLPPKQTTLQKLKTQAVWNIFPRWSTSQI